LDSVLPPGVVVVRENDNVLTSEVLAILFTPLSRSSGVAGGDQAEFGESIGILLTFDNMHRFTSGGSNQFRKPVGYEFDPPHVPSPSAGAIGPPMSEVLGFQPAHLKPKFTIFVFVVVLLHDLSAALC